MLNLLQQRAESLVKSGGPRDSLASSFGRKGRRRSYSFGGVGAAGVTVAEAELLPSIEDEGPAVPPIRSSRESNVFLAPVGGGKLWGRGLGATGSGRRRSFSNPAPPMIVESMDSGE